ncbi:myosin-6 protein [Spatholobus suberectus]|nr:myosin-6 protein [Spatholobus suberectus]
MAKKKVSHQSQSQSQDFKQSQTETPIMPMEDPSVQINNLKNLNAVLLKETTQRRQQIESLESALRRSAVASDAFHLESAVVSVFVESQVKEMSLRFDALVGERECEVAALKRELNDLRARLQHETSVLVRERDALVYEVQRLEQTVNSREEASRRGREAKVGG